MGSYSKKDELYNEGYLLGFKAAGRVLKRLLTEGRKPKSLVLNDENQENDIDENEVSTSTQFSSKNQVGNFESLKKRSKALPWKTKHNELNDILKNSNKKYFSPTGQKETEDYLKTAKTKPLTYAYLQNEIKGVTSDEYSNDNEELDKIEVAYNKLKNEKNGATVEIDGEKWGKVMWPKIWFDSVSLINKPGSDKESHQVLRLFTVLKQMMTPKHVLSSWVIPTLIIKKSKHNNFKDLIIPFNCTVRVMNGSAAKDVDHFTRKNNRKYYESKARSGELLYNNLMKNDWIPLRMIYFSIKENIPEFADEELWDYGHGNMKEAEEWFSDEVKMALDLIIDMINSKYKGEYDEVLVDNVSNYINTHHAVKHTLKEFREELEDYKEKKRIEREKALN